MLSIGHCPKCGERVRIPQVDGQSQVRCPWCNAEFELQQLIQNLPPVLEVISAVQASEYNPAGTPADLGDTDGFDFRLADSPDSEASDLSSLSASPDFSPSERMSPNLATRPRAKRRRESPFVTFMKMAGGGVAGLVIAVIILQAIGRLPDLGFWPFRGPGTQLIPKDLFGDGSNSSRTDRQENLSTQFSDNSTPERAANNEPIDLGTPDFSQMQSPATNDPESEPAESKAAGTSAENVVQQATEVLNDYIRSNIQTDEAAIQIQALLASLASNLPDDAESSDSIIKQLDSFVERLKEERELLRAIVAESTKQVQNLLDAENSETEGESRQVALIGATVRQGDSLSLQTSSKKIPLISMSLPQAQSKLAEQILIIVIGEITATEEGLNLTASYLQPLAK